MKLRLYHYWRSSCSWRVRWAFQIKKIECEMVSVGLLDGEVDSELHRSRNPMGYVPVIEILDEASKGKGRFLSESLAIIEWAEELWPNPSILPGTAWERAIIRQLAETINSGTQPLQNLSPTHLHSADASEQKKWMQHWIRNGLKAYEQLCQADAGLFSLGDTITLADLCLVPQVYNAKRQEVSLDDFPTIARIYENALREPTCIQSSPETHQP